MTKIKHPLKSDEKTIEYLMGLMQSLPMKLFDSVKELRDISAVIRRNVDALDRNTQIAYEQLAEDLANLSARIHMLEQIVSELCDVATAAMSLRPMMTVMEKKQEEEEKEDGECE